MLPQIIENFKQKRVKGLSHLLVFLNNIGDAMKLAYFFLNVKIVKELGPANAVQSLWVHPGSSGSDRYSTDHLLRQKE